MAVNTEAVRNQLATKAQAPNEKRPVKVDPAQTVYKLLEMQMPEIRKALPRHITPERLARVALTTIRQNPDLLSCSQQSLLGTIMLCAQLGLEPGPLGHAYIVPFKGEATFILGYKGYLELMWRSGRLESLAVHEVCENDEFEFEYGLNEKLRHKPALTNRGKAIAYYLVARYKDGGHFVYVMSVEDIEKHKARSKAKDSGPWVTDYDAMARKTVVREAARWMPLSIEIQRALEADEATAELKDDGVEINRTFDSTAIVTDTIDSQAAEAVSQPETPPAASPEANSGLFN